MAHRTIHSDALEEVCLGHGRASSPLRDLSRLTSVLLENYQVGNIGMTEIGISRDGSSRGDILFSKTGCRVRAFLMCSSAE